MERLGLTSSRQRRPDPQDRSPYPENLRAIIYKYGLQGESAHWVNEHWDDGRYFPTIERQRPDNFDRTLRRWLKGEGIAQEEIDEVLYAALWERHGVPRALTEKMHEAAGELPRFDRQPPSKKESNIGRLTGHRSSLICKSTERLVSVTVCSYSGHIPSRISPARSTHFLRCPSQKTGSAGSCSTTN